MATSSSGETSWSAYLDVRGLSQRIPRDSSTTNIFQMTSPGSEFADIHLLSLIFFSPWSDSTDLIDFVSHNATALPGPPSKPEVTDVTKSSISLSWEPGQESGSPVSSYVIEAFGYVCDLQPRATFSDPELSGYQQMWGCCVCGQFNKNRGEV